MLLFNSFNQLVYTLVLLWLMIVSFNILKFASRIHFTSYFSEIIYFGGWDHGRKRTGKQGYVRHYHTNHTSEIPSIY